MILWLIAKCYQHYQKAAPSCVQSVGTHGSTLRVWGHSPPLLLQHHLEVSCIWRLSLLGVSSPWLCMCVCVYDIQLVPAWGPWECSVHWPQTLMKHIIWTWVLFNYLTPQNCLLLWKIVSRSNSIVFFLFPPLDICLSADFFSVHIGGRNIIV